MSPLTHLLLAACVLAAPIYSASIPDAPELKRTPAIAPEEIKEIKEPIEILPNQDESIIENETVKKIENEPEIKPAENIPVEVVVENVEPSVKINEVADDDEIKRPQLDLRNPGPPQRQEHETQNPEHYTEEVLRLYTIKQNIEQTQNLLKQGFQGVSEDIQHWFSNNEQNKVQQGIQNFRETFTAQIRNLNNAVRGLVKIESPESSESQVKSNIQNIESRLKILEDNFNNGVKTLSEGVHIVATLKSVSEDSDTGREESVPEIGSSSAGAVPEVPVSPAQPAPPQNPPTTNPPQNFILQYIDIFGNTLSNSVNNVTSAVNNFISGLGQNTGFPFGRPPSSTLPPGVQADQGVTASSTTRPPWQIFNFGNLSNGLNNPIAQLFNFFNNGGSTTPAAVPAVESADKPAATQSSNVPAATAAQPAPAAPSEPAKQPEPAAQPASAPQPLGPIREIINNNPIVQSIAGAVQRIQSSITNTERLRDTVDKDNQSAKGVWIPPPKPPHGGGDNIDVAVELSDSKPEETKEPQQEEAQKEAEQQEVKPEPSKTE